MQNRKGVLTMSGVTMMSLQLATLAFLTGCTGEHQKAGQDADRAAGVPAGQVGPNETRGKQLDATKEMQEAKADAIEVEADSVREAADRQADALEREAKRLRSEADVRADDLDKKAELARQELVS